TVVLSLLQKLPKASKIRTAGAGESVTPAVAVAGGCVCIAKLAAGPTLTVKAALTALGRPEPLAVSTLPEPTESMRKLVNRAVPLPAAVPMSKVLVPWSGPVPLLRLTVTGILAGKPAAVLLPNWSSVRTIG